MLIVFDNYNECCSSLQPLWGFSAYFKEYGLLFDTGSNGRILLKNLHAFNIDIKTIQYLFISHAHWDHIGGIDSVLELNPDMTLFVPQTLSKHLIKDLQTLAKEVVVISQMPQRLFENVYTTGLLGEEMPEQSLVIDAEERVVITGCGHFGIANIVDAAAEIISKPIELCVGGFHLLYSDEEAITQTITLLKQKGVRRVCPTHCSGDDAIAMIARSFGTEYIQGGIGAEISL